MFQVKSKKGPKPYRLNEEIPLNTKKDLTREGKRKKMDGGTKRNKGQSAGNHQKKKKD